jgi:hypothetical protein
MAPKTRARRATPGLGGRAPEAKPQRNPRQRLNLSRNFAIKVKRAIKVEGKRNYSQDSDVSFEIHKHGEKEYILRKITSKQGRVSLDFYNINGKAVAVPRELRDRVAREVKETIVTERGMVIADKKTRPAPEKPIESSFLKFLREHPEKLERGQKGIIPGNSEEAVRNRERIERARSTISAVDVGKIRKMRRMLITAKTQARAKGFEVDKHASIGGFTVRDLDDLETVANLERGIRSTEAKIAESEERAERYEGEIKTRRYSRKSIDEEIKGRWLPMRLFKRILMAARMFSDEVELKKTDLSRARTKLQELRETRNRQSALFVKHWNEKGIGELVWKYKSLQGQEEVAEPKVA